MLGKDIFGSPESLVAGLGKPGEILKKREKTKNNQPQFILGFMLYLELGWGTLGEPHREEHE